jgi:oligopeptide transport system substrate-binding protein
VTLEALDSMLRHRLIDEETGPMGRDYAFTHHKIQEVVYAGMGRRRRQHAHTRAGTAMERLYGPEVKTLAGELAFHFEQGRQLDKSLTEKAIHYLLEAGDQARGLYAHGDAIDYYQRALALLKEQGDYERAARTLMKLGLTYHSAFDFRQARQAYEEGFALWQRAGAMEPAVRPLPAPHALRVGMIYHPQNLDPAMAGHVASAAVKDQLFSGLVEQSPEMEVMPDVARNWETLESGRKYVFHLRDDVRWSDGTPVTAEDFEYAWKRVLDPATGWPAAHLLYDVKGARAFHRGEAGKGDVGVRALDEVTLAVELERPTGYFPHLVAYNATYPVPRHVVEAYGESWTEVGNVVTNGPFRLEAWKRGESMTLVRNPEYHGQFRGNVQRVGLSLRLDRSAILELYEADGLDTLILWGFLPPGMDRVRQRQAGEYVSVPWLLTWYVGFDVSRPPFDDVRVRRAFALATDRETLADVVLRGYVSPATGGYVPPGMPGHSPGIGLPYDPEQAQHLLAEAGYPGGCSLPTVDSLVPYGRESLSEYLQAQWREDLGVETTWEAMEWAKYLDGLEREPPHIFLCGWLADYPDPDSFLRANPVRRWTRWQNGAYDRLVEEARQVTDQGKRMKLYGQADRILVEEAAIVPLTYERLHLLVQPWVRRYPTSAIKYWFWKDVIIEPH